MRTIRITGHVDEHHQLSAEVPDVIPPGPVMISVSVESHEDEAGTAWSAGIANEWADELADARQDIYTLADGEPVREP